MAIIITPSSLPSGSVNLLYGVNIVADDIDIEESIKNIRIINENEAKINS
jgi:hypothetical protein